jgi:hypothetical protein
MRFLGRLRRPRRDFSRPWSPRRWVLVLLGLGVLGAAFAGAEEPYRQTRQFRQIAACEGSVGGCFARERGSIVGRYTYTTSTTHIDANGHATTSTTTHYELAWRRSDGSRQSREVSKRFYQRTRKGAPATLLLLREEVAGIRMAGVTHWFLPEVGYALFTWLFLAHLGLGLLLWELLFDWRDGTFCLVFRAVAWVLAGITPLSITAEFLAYGLHFGTDLVLDLVFGALITGLGVLMLLGSLRGVEER